MEPVPDTARVLLTAALLSITAIGVYVWNLTRLDPGGPERLIAQLRLAQWAALALAALGAGTIGFAAANQTPSSPLDVSLGLAFVIVAAFVLQREPREALLIAAGAFLLQAFLNLVHRPHALAPIAPGWYTAGAAIYDVFFAGICYWARRS